VKQHESYRPLIETIETLDNVGTKAACPTHLLEEGGRKEDYSHVESKVSSIWKGKGARSGRKSPGAVGRPSELLVRSIREQYQ
jgi:hypothetical protein